ncbi:MAG TPA: efflux RND transporter periplasmic adaptor subunit [Mucilaginibacter sp.]|jgi:cobalt-zinc-cadmium efflux system membrane fusion protein|nr:efflux RND transporter periplasmic adaptor subunit [Mucilaginibacter sp.]
MSKRYNIFTFIISVSFAAAALQGCHHNDESQKDEKFEVTDSLLNSLLIDTVKEASALSQINLTGSIAADENKMVNIYPMVSGVAHDVKVQLGDAVSKGETLAVLKSAEMAGYTKDYISAEADLRSAKRTFESTQDLYKSGLASQKEFEDAQSDYQKAIAENKRAGEVVNINKSNDQGYLVKAPISGFIIEKNLTDNQQVRTDNNTNLFSIADLSDVYVLINIYESDISNVQVGDPVKITTLSYPDKTFTGKIDKIYDMLDPDNKVVKARVKIENPGNRLKPQMFASVTIKATSGEKLPVVSTRGLIFDNDKYYVVVVDGKAKVHIQQIDIAKRVEDRAYIRAGLKAGDRIVASRQLYLFESLKD